MIFVVFLLILLPIFSHLTADPITAAETERAIKHDHERKNKTAPMVLVSAGPFPMGREGANPDEQPIHRVLLNAFFIDAYEVTVAEYAKFLENEEPDPPLLWKEAQQDENRQKPVLGVDWYDAAAYCRWAGKRLPTEAEWEKAARGTDSRMYPWGNEPPTSVHGNFGNESAKGYTAAAKVGSFEKGKSPYGIFDLAGNVWEWVADRYDEHYYQHSPQHNPQGPATGPLRVLRGGAWNSALTIIASANRNANVPSDRRSDVGFRCAKDAQS
jgi:formylglycine-generating enzyme required for sulfatase activity